MTSRKFTQYLKNSALLVLCWVMSSVAAGITFIDVWEYRVDGNNLLHEEQVQRALQPYLGAARTIDEIEYAAKALQKLYRNEGYPAVFVNVPEQDVNSGIVRIAVTETKVRRVKITGAKYFKPSDIKDQLASVDENTPLNLPRLQEDLKKINSANPDLKVVPLIEAGPTPDTIDLELSVADELPLHASFELNNYHTATTTPTRAAFEVKYGNLWQKNHKASFQLQTSPEEKGQVKVFAGSYQLPIGEQGKKLALYAVKSDSDIAAVNSLNVLGKGEILGGRLIWPLVQEPKEIHSFVLGMDYKDFDEEIVTPAGTLFTPIDYLVWSGKYNLLKRNENSTDLVSAGVNFGIRGVFNENEEFDNKNSRADSNFAYLDIEWKRDYRLPAGWGVTHQLRAQHSGAVLVSNERLSAGGVNSVRGYFESQLQGDSGVIANLGVTSPNLFDATEWLNLKTLFFYDHALIYRQDSGIDEGGRNFSISSLGLGLEIELLDNLKLKIASGYALEDESEVNRGTVRPAPVSGLKCNGNTRLMG